MERQSYEDWSLELHQRVLSQRTPISGSIELTKRCNLRCVHCYNNLPLGDHEARNSELTFEEHCQIIDEITEAGCLWLLYTGGEIFSRRDFLEIYTYAKQQGFLITLFSNGTLITPSIADYLAEWRPFSVEISFYGRTKETYERVTGIPGSFEGCLRGIRLLMERDIPLILKSMVLTLNKHEIWEMKHFVEEELGLEFRFDALLNPRVDGSLTPLSTRISPREVLELDLLDPRRMIDWRRFCDHFHGEGVQESDGDRCKMLYRCGGGRNAFAIDPSGLLSTCVLWHGPAYDLRKGTFREGWEDFLMKVTQKRMTRETKCVFCDLKSMCGMCPANGELEKRDGETPVDFLCHVAHLRAYVLGLPVSPHGDCEYCEGGTRYDDLVRTLEELRRK